MPDRKHNIKQQLAVGTNSTSDGGSSQSFGVDPQPVAGGSSLTMIGFQLPLVGLGGLVTQEMTKANVGNWSTVFEEEETNCVCILAFQKHVCQPCGETEAYHHHAMTVLTGW